MEPSHCFARIPTLWALPENKEIRQSHQAYMSKFWKRIRIVRASTQKPCPVTSSQVLDKALAHCKQFTYYLIHLHVCVRATEREEKELVAH